MKASAFFLGVLFALGLGVSGMTNPEKVLGFLDLFGQWDPSLAFVMVGAIGVSFFAFRFGPRQPLVHGAVDRRLVAGAALFGVGWGLAGLCPGPSLVGLTTGKASVVVFVLSMLTGMALVSAPIVRRSTLKLRALFQK